MIKTFKLKEFNNPAFLVSSTAALAVSTPGGGANSFSFPPILYYAKKAILLSKLGILDESEPLEKRYLNVSENVVKFVRQMAKNVYSDVENSDASMDKYISCAIQSRLLNSILEEPEIGEQSLINKPALSINASRSSKNITIPFYLMSKITTLLNSEKSARLLIHETVYEIRKTLLSKGDLIVENGKDILIGEAANSSWSRKLHNTLIIKLIEMSNIKEISNRPSIFDVTMEHEIKLETKFRAGHR
jgi:hypothetical protein